MFQKATKKQAKLRLALIGPSGAGKTFSALNIAQNLGERIAVIDTERGSASKYSDIFRFDVGELETHNPEDYIRAINEAEQAGYEVLVIDSLTHAWSGKDGALEMVDQAAAKSKSGNTYTAWRNVTPLHNRLVDTILQSRCHVIATMRAKTEYVLQADSKGNIVPKKIGMAPIQRDGMEYEFDVTGDLTLDHELIVTKTRCHLIDGKVFPKPGKQFALILASWLSDGTPVPKTVSTEDQKGSIVAQSPANTDSLVESPAPVMTDGQIRLEQIKMHAAAVHIKANFIGNYFKTLNFPVKKPTDEWLTEAVFEAAVLDLDKVAEKLAAKLQENYTNPSDKDVRDAFVEVLNEKKSDGATGSDSDKPVDTTASPEPTTTDAVETPTAEEVLVGSNVASP